MLSKSRVQALLSQTRATMFLLKVFVLLSLFALSFVGAHIADPPAPGVTAELRCDEGSGTTAADASGNAHPGTLTNGPTWGAGKYGQGINLDGTNDYVNLVDHADYTLTPTVSYTWSAWVRNNNFNQWSTVWSQTLSTSSFFYFYAHSSGDAEAGPVTNGISVYWYSGSNKLVLHSNNNVLTTGTWSYITVTYNAGVAQASRFTIYVNGADVTNRTDVVSTGTIAAIDPNNTRIGSNQPFGEYLNGSVDEIRYYRRLLSVAEIQSDMNIGNSPDAQSPTVNITSPAAGNVSGTINVNANAGDNVGVSGVQFLLDGNNLGAEDLTSPYSVSWNTTTASTGNHTVTARARDAAGNTTISAAVIVNVNNNDVTAPTVNITAPAAGNVSGTINVTGNAGDNIGVAGVQFLLDGNNLGAEDVAAPYSVSWNTTTAGNGNHDISARARDAAGNTTPSAIVSVNVNNDTQAPTVTVDPPSSSPVSGAINVTATANDNIAIAGVQFLLDGNNLGAEDLALPYSVPWNTSTASNGNHTLTARARDAAGNITTSAAVLFNVFNNGLVASYGFNENTGTTANDSSGNNNTGTLTNGPTWSASGKYGAAILFDGTNDFVNINDANSLDLTNAITIEAWVNASNLTGYKTAICKENGTNNLSYALSPNNNTSGAANQRPNTRIRIGTTTTTVTGTTKLALNTWTHIASTYDGAVLRLYINGAQVSTVNVTGNMGTSTNPLRIGGTTALAQYFAGLVDEVRIYSRPLSQLEIQTDMNTPITPIAPDVTNPSVNMTAPANNANVSGTLNVSANASDNISVVGVLFLLDGSNLGTEAVTAPYSISWNTTTLANGSYSLTARARDAAGNTTTSTAAVVTVDNSAPTVNLTGPAAGTIAGTVDINADANDNNGVVGVQFLLNGVNLGTEDQVAPYSFSWNTNSVTDGTYTLTARARDAAGNFSTSPGIVVNVLNHPPDTEPPTISITSPAAGEITGTVNIDADANDNVAVVGVQFLVNRINTGAEDLAAPYSNSWNSLNVPNGTYTLTAKARDAAGNITSSADVVVTVNNPQDTESPTVTIIEPGAGTISGTVNLVASANDNIGIIGVQFLLDGNNLGSEDLTFPYSFSWNTSGTGNGIHIISARTRDAAGNITTSDGVDFTINNDVQNPTVNVTSPAGGSVSGTINVTADANDNIGVVGVQFLLNGSLLGAEDVSVPYSVNWNTLTATNGTYNLTAKARDAAGNFSISTAVVVAVSNVTNLINAIHFNEGTGTNAADISGKNHNGVLTGGTTWTAGKYGQSVNLNGSSNYVNIADHADYTLNPTQNYTWSGWVRNNNLNQWSTIWSQTLNTSTYLYFYAHSSADANAGPVTNGVSVYWSSGSGKLVLHSNDNVLTTGTWNYVTVTYNASVAQASRFTIYVNGADVTNGTDVVSTGTIATIDPNNIRIGSNQPFGEYLNGAIDELRFYNRLLTSAEIQADMNSPIEIDNTAPAVNLTSPVNNSNVSGIVTVTANATDNVGVAGVQFMLDGSNLGAEDIASPYSVSWNTATSTAGSHILTARARDATGNNTTSANINVTIASDFSFTLLNPSQNVGVTDGTDFGVDVTYLNGFTSNNVALSVTGLPTGVTGNYLVNPLTNQGQTQLHIVTTNATPGTYILTLSATAQSITHTQQATLIINGAADFSLSASPAIRTVAAGNGTSYTITIGETGDFVSPVTLSVQGLPTGTNASFNPGSAIPVGTSVLTITTSASTPSGTYNLTIQGSSGSLTHTIAITLTVSSTPPVTWPVTTIGSGWNMPIGAAFTKDGQKLFVWEKAGKVFVCNRNAATQVYEKQTTPVIDLSVEVGNWDDHGLNGFALDPNFATNGFIYLLYVVDRRFLMNDATPVDQGAVATIGRVTRYKTVNSGGNPVADLSTRTVLLGETKSTGIPVLHDSHGMGSLVFASDGTLLISAGDGSTYNSTDAGSLGGTYYAQALADGIIRSEENVGAFRAQLLNSHNGKILRIDPVTGNGVESNPFYNASQPRSPKSRVWALGFRNPFRFNIRPGTGSTNPSAGDIGEIYVGDVGWRTYEELNIIKAPATNCGWPIFEGVELEKASQPGENPYYSFTTANMDEPNPLFGTGGCTKQYFSFNNLIKQATADGSTTVFNPCNSSVPISSGNSNRFVHRRPVIDWKQYVDSSRVPLFNGNNTTFAQVGSAASNVSGSPFPGNCSIGGTWYTGNLFPAEFRNTYIQADYGAQWIKSFTIGFTDVIQKVQNLASGVGAIVCLTENPFDGTLIYVDIGTNSVKAIGYGGNQVPVVKMTSDVTYGSTALNVNFTGSNSFDPDGGTITYLWNFGDATTSTSPNPSHSFTAPVGTPKKFTVTLSVKDNQNSTTTDSIIISVNNTPPNVHITSPVDSSTYNIGPDSTYAFTATVIDAEHSSSQLKYQWQKILRHNNHEHPGPIDTAKVTSASVARVGCNGESYYWLIRLKVTDAAGLSTTDSSKIFPNCSSARIALVLRKFSVTQEGSGNVVNWTTDMAPQIKDFEVERSTDGINFFTVGREQALKGIGTKNYSFNDNHFPAGVNYYRLRMNEIGEVSRYSLVVKTVTDIRNERLAIIPNPATGNFSLRYSARENSPVIICIRDINGREVSTVHQNVNKGENIIYVQNMTSWKPGVYLVSVQQGKDIQHGKLVYY